MSEENGKLLLPEYRHSWALIIGINQYKHLPPLSYAVNDARAVAATLVERFNFPEQRIIQLIDGDASREAILSAFDETLTDKNKLDRQDRLLVFFAGHGLTRHGNQGQIGYIAPADAKPRAWRSLIAMTDLTDLAAFVPAKHIFFIMDACYSGLALARGGGLDAHVERMLAREAWQVLTAGKADEEVADGGGPNGANSIFTGYLLEALTGAAAGRNGLLTASYVMSYVYSKLVNDPRSSQTPHFGWLRGDGDFVFQKPLLPVLPTAIDIALEHGDDGARARAVHALSRLTRIEDWSLADLALDRLERVARLDSATSVRQQAAYLLGWIPSPGETRPSGSTLVELALQFDTQRNSRPRGSKPGRWPRLALAGLALLLVAGGSLAGLSSIASARQGQGQRQETAHLETLAAQDGALVATLMAAPSETAVPQEEDLPPRPTQTPHVLASPTNSPSATVQASQQTALAATPEAFAGSAILFADDFSDVGGGWETGSADSALRSIEFGQLRFWVNSDYTLWASRPASLGPQSNVVFSATATVLEGEGDFSYGLIFRQVDFDNYYYFLVGNHGNFLVAKQLGGVGSLLVELTSLNLEVLPPDAPEVRLTVLAVGPDFTFFVNGYPVAQARDTAFASGRLGVAVQTLTDYPVRVAFDDVVIQRP